MFKLFIFNKNVVSLRCEIILLSKKQIVSFIFFCNSNTINMLNNTVLLGWFGGQEIIIILIIVLLLFGGTKIPQLMRGLGKGMNEFKKAKEGLYDDLDENGKKTTKTTQVNESKN